MTDTMNGRKARIFKDREEAGRLLAQELAKAGIEKPAVFGLPRGGIPVAHQVATALDAPLDTVVSRKLGTPGNPEFGFGAIAPGDIVILNNTAVDSLGLTRDQIDQVLAAERVELDRRMTHYLSGEFTKGIEFETAVIVDDGLATGVTAAAAIESVKLVQKPKKVYFASPVCSEEAMRLIRDKVDDILCLNVPEYFLAVGQSYTRFNQVSDDEVLYLLHTWADARSAARK